MPSTEVHQDGRVTFDPLKASLQQVEILHIEYALRAHGWNKVHTADSLGISRSALYSKIKQYRLVRPKPLA